MKRCIVDSNASEIIIQRDSVNRVSIRIGRSQFSMENRLLFVTFTISIEIKFSIDPLSCKKEERRKQRGNRTVP